MLTMSCTCILTISDSMPEPSYLPVPAYPAVSSSSGSVSPLVKCSPAPAPMAAMAPAPLPACQPYKPFATATVPALGESGE